MSVHACGGGYHKSSYSLIYADYCLGQWKYMRRKYVMNHTRFSDWMMNYWMMKHMMM